MLLNHKLFDLTVKCHDLPPRLCAEKDDTGSPTTYWKPQLATAPLTAAFALHLAGAPSAAGSAIMVADVMAGVTGPYMAEGPAAMLEMIQEEPTGAH